MEHRSAAEISPTTGSYSLSQRTFHLSLPPPSSFGSLPSEVCQVSTPRVLSPLCRPPSSWTSTSLKSLLVRSLGPTHFWFLGGLGVPLADPVPTRLEPPVSTFPRPRGTKVVGEIRPPRRFRRRGVPQSVTRVWNVSTNKGCTRETDNASGRNGFRPRRKSPTGG